MTGEPNKRPRRNPLTSEEVSHIIAHKKKRELIALRKLKKSKLFIFLNVFNVICFFVFLELLFCYFGPSKYTNHSATNTLTHYGSGKPTGGKLFVSTIDIYNSEGRLYKLVINECIAAPAHSIHFLIGKDFLLQKELKGYMEGYTKAYRLFSASPLILLSILASFSSLLIFVMNLNEKIYNLAGLSLLNFLTLFTILLL